jgi:hypothetical protein
LLMLLFDCWGCLHMMNDSAERRRHFVEWEEHYALLPGVNSGSVFLACTNGKAWTRFPQNSGISVLSMHLLYAIWWQTTLFSAAGGLPGTLMGLDDRGGNRRQEKGVGCHQMG